VRRRLLLAALALPALAPSPVAAKEEANLPWRRTYAEALLEARVRNVPVLVTRQKDE